MNVKFSRVFGEPMRAEVSKKVVGKKAAASHAVDLIGTNTVLGLGTGSTATYFLEELARKISIDGLDIVCVATSKVTFENAKDLNIPVADMNCISKIDLVVDGADEFDKKLNMIKGGGGALLKEKIVASAAESMIVITDYSKEVDTLGNFPLPVEVVKFGVHATENLIQMLLLDLGYKDFKILPRKNQNRDFISDEGHFIIDLDLGEITELSQLQNSLLSCPGVVETGLFLGLAKKIIVGQADGSCRVLGSESIP